MRFEFLQILPSNSTADLVRIHVSGGGTTNISMNGVQLQGYREQGDKRKWMSGITVEHFVPGDLLDIIYTDGDIHAIGNQGLILTSHHWAGQVRLEPSAAELEEYASLAELGKQATPTTGVMGVLTRFACCDTDFTTHITGGQT